LIADILFNSFQLFKLINPHYSYFKENVIYENKVIDDLEIPIPGRAGTSDEADEQCPLPAGK